MLDGENCFRCGKWHNFEELTADLRGWSFCGRCAAKLSTEGRPKRRCPDDGRWMVKLTFGFILVDKRQACGGVWLGPDEAQALTEYARRAPWGRVEPGHLFK